MKAHIGVDAESGLVHSVIGAAPTSRPDAAASLLRGDESDVFADAGLGPPTSGCGRQDVLL